jgi:hypothetical protein
VSTTAPEHPVRFDASVRPLDERIARAAVAWSLDPRQAVDEAADELLVLAQGNRTAVERALARLGARRGRPPHTTSGRASTIMRLTLARGDWAW